MDAEVEEVVKSAFPWLRVLEVGGFIALVVAFVWYDVLQERRGGPRLGSNGSNGSGGGRRIIVEDDWERDRAAWRRREAIESERDRWFR